MYDYCFICDFLISRNFP